MLVLTASATRIKVRLAGTIRLPFVWIIYYYWRGLCPKFALSRVLSPPRSSSAVRLERRLRIRFSPASTTTADRSGSSLKSRPACPLSIWSYGMSSDHKARPDPQVRKDLRVRRDPRVPRAQPESLARRVKRDLRARLGLRNLKGRQDWFGASPS